MLPINMKDYNINIQLSLENFEKPLEISNNITQYYEFLIEKYENTTNFYIKCPKCGGKEFTWASSYTRTLKVPNSDEDGKITLYIDIRRIKFSCECTKDKGKVSTHALIPDFITPYKQHSKQFITEMLNEKEKMSYKEVEEKYDISKELHRFWKRCFESIHKSYITILLELQGAKEMLEKILSDIDDFNEKYYKRFKLSFMQFTSKQIL